MKKNFILISSIIICILLFIVEQYFGVNYYIKSFSKIIMFIIIPVIYYKKIESITFKKALNINKLSKKDLNIGIILGILCFTILIISYFVFKNFIDFESIIKELEDKSKITTSNFILVGLYITLGNSFLEEFFFRGFIFLNLYEIGYKKLAYIFSSTLFGIYHIAIFKTWFNVWITILALFGLISIGMIFNYINTKCKNFLNSWIVHILADSAIILIGLKLFKII